MLFYGHYLFCGAFYFEGMDERKEERMWIQSLIRRVDEREEKKTHLWISILDEMYVVKTFIQVKVKSK